MPICIINKVGSNYATRTNYWVYANIKALRYDEHQRINVSHTSKNTSFLTSLKCTFYVVNMIYKLFITYKLLLMDYDLESKNVLWRKVCLKYCIEL